VSRQRKFLLITHHSLLSLIPFLFAITIASPKENAAMFSRGILRIDLTRVSS